MARECLQIDLAARQPGQCGDAHRVGLRARQAGHLGKGVADMAGGMGRGEHCDHPFVVTHHGVRVFLVVLIALPGRPMRTAT